MASDEHAIMADIFRQVLADNRYAFRSLGTYINEDGRPGFRRFANIAGRKVYLTEAATQTGRDINELVEMVARARIDRTKSVAYSNHQLGDGLRIEFWCDNIWIHMFMPNVVD